MLSLTSTEWRLGIKWVLANVVVAVVSGTIGGRVLIFLLRMRIITSNPSQMFPLVTLSVSVIHGSLFGIGQWFILRQCFLRSGWWILSTIAGCAIGGFASEAIVKVILSVLDPQIPQYWTVQFALDPTMREDWIANGLGLGISCGIAQWLTLRLRFHHASLWIPASALGWTTAYIVGSTRGMPLVGTPTALYFQITEGVLVGIITGIALTWLVQNPILRSMQTMKDPA
jgi:hypothetical protein